ncbi:hypothetical protein Syun_003753 [Stephania yunnanensis]|uniref:USP domain-containing protein n=1 Tax=Stephania yunnanensis TaxID=152371 RepID=A0AAP0Q474_9MAGN
MLVPGDLGFPGLVFVFLFFVGPIFGFAIRLKWRKAVGRKREVMRLVAMASEEAARAELEAAAELGAVAVARQTQCAVCYRPTTTRCSRCKAVHYWYNKPCFRIFVMFWFELFGFDGSICVFLFSSGKCQIIHWRQGHKDECHPPQFNDLQSNSRMRPACNMEEMLHVNQLESEGKLRATSTEILNEEKVFASSKSKVEEPQFHNIAVKEHEKTAVVNRLEETESPCSEFISSDASVGSSHLITSKQTIQSSNAELDICGSANPADSGVNAVHNCIVSGPPKGNKDFWDGTLDSAFSKDKCDTSPVNACSPSHVCEDAKSGYKVLASSTPSLHFSFGRLKHVVPISCSRCDEPGSTISGNASTLILDEKVSYDASFSEKALTNATSDYNFQTLNTEKSAYLGDGSGSSQSLKPKRTRSFSGADFDYNKLSVSGENSDLPIKSSEVEGAHKVPPASLEIANSVPYASNSVKTSVRKVVQQSKAYKLSKHCSPGFTDISNRYNHKMLFPYEVFIKLYNWNKVNLHPCGLLNCGNSCYANVVLQCLAFTRPLTSYLLQRLHSKTCKCLKKEWCFTCEFESLVLKAKEEKSPISPAGILSHLETIGSHLGHGREEDAHEFLRYAIDTLQSVCLKEAGETAVGSLAEETTLIGLMFGGYLKSKIKCVKCHGKSEHHERMMDLTVEIQGDIGTLDDALGQFTAHEVLDGENKYYCSRILYYRSDRAIFNFGKIHDSFVVFDLLCKKRCKSYEKAKKKLTVLEAPNILTIALKRFQTGKFGKLNKSVHFPEILNMAPYISGTNDKSPIYRLYAVIVHVDVMNATFSGHYVCFVRNIQGNWFKLDDSTVEPVELENVLSREAYMLFYARCSPRAPGLIRNSILCNDVKCKSSRRCLETNHNRKSTLPCARPGIVHPKSGICSELRRPEDLSNWASFDGHRRYESLDSFERMFHSMNRIHKVDSSSDNSSLLSCSDEGSCSTESTRDSSSTDDFSEYVVVEAVRTSNSPLRDFDVSSSPLSARPPQFAASETPQDYPGTSGYSMCGGEVDGILTGESNEGRHPIIMQNKESLPILCSDRSKHFGKLTGIFSYNNSYRETDVQKLEQCKALNVKSGVHLRRSTNDRTAETFY